MINMSTTKLLQAAVILAGVHQTVSAISFPPPTGPFNTSLTAMELIDYHRLDPYAATRQPRAVMISLFQPVSPSKCSQSLAPYMNPITASFEDSQFAVYGIPPGTFESLNLQVCQQATSRQRRSAQTYPLILFSPGLGEPRLFYSVMAQQVASSGYTVVTIDHPYDADIVTFPDNSSALAANISTDAQILQDLDTRIKDISFILDQLSLPSVSRKLIPSLTCGLDVSTVGIYGHSLGGASAAEAMLYDSRLVGGINLDGSFFGNVIEKGLNRPFLIFGHEGKNRSTDPSWEAIWPKLRGWKRELTLAGSAHGTFTDLPDVVDALGIAAELPDAVAQLLGTIDGARALRIVTTYVSSFFDFVLKGKNSKLLDGPTTTFPEVSF